MCRFEKMAEERKRSKKENELEMVVQEPEQLKVSVRKEAKQRGFE
jgi:hypothetical protein